MVNKQQVVILVIAAVVVAGVIVGVALVQNPAPPSGGQVTPPPQTSQPPKELFSLTAQVVKVDTANDTLTVKPANQTNELKVTVSETTKLVRIEFPFDPKNPPKEGTFTPKQTEIKLSNFKAGDTVFIKTKENVFGKSEFDNVDFIHILP